MPQTQYHGLTRREFLRNGSIAGIGTALFGGIEVFLPSNTYAAQPDKSLTEQFFDSLVQNPHLYRAKEGDYFVRSRLNEGDRVAEVWVSHPAKVVAQVISRNGIIHPKTIPDATEPLKLMWGYIPRPAYHIIDENYDGVPDKYEQIDPRIDGIIPLRNHPEKSKFTEMFVKGLSNLIEKIEKESRDKKSK